MKRVETEIKSRYLIRPDELDELFAAAWSMISQVHTWKARSRYFRIVEERTFRGKASLSKRDMLYSLSILALHVLLYFLYEGGPNSFR